MLHHHPLQLIRPNWSVPANIRAFTTTRTLGVSRTPYDSLNFGSHVGDEHAAVLRNRQHLVQDLQLPNEPVWLDQVHGKDLLQIGNDFHHSDETQADGAYTREAGAVCAVMTADCLPILITNLRGDRVAAIHVGWRGMAAGIIEASVAQMQEYPEQLIAWGGPCIGPSVFEVGGEVPDQLGGPEDAYRPSANSGKQLVNLHRLAAYRFKQLGVEQYSHSEACTFSDAERFFSYRRDGQCGRMVSVIWMQA